MLPISLEIIWEHQRNNLIKDVDVLPHQLIWKIAIQSNAGLPCRVVESEDFLGFRLLTPTPAVLKTRLWQFKKKTTPTQAENMRLHRLWLYNPASLSMKFLPARKESCVCTIFGWWYSFMITTSLNKSSRRCCRRRSIFFTATCNIWSANKLLKNKANSWRFINFTLMRNSQEKNRCWPSMGRQCIPNVVLKNGAMDRMVWIEWFAMVQT